MHDLQINYREALHDCYNLVLSEENLGLLPTYIPEIASVSPEKFGVFFCAEAQRFGTGDFAEKFTIQSIGKVLSMALAYKMLGDALWERVDMEPSGTAFNSLLQLESDRGIPRNPLINAGALVVCDILISKLKDAKSGFIDFVRDLANDNTINYSAHIAESEKSVGFRNYALGYYIKSLGNLVNHPEEVLDFYFHLCSIEMTCEQLAYTFSLFANDGVKLHDGERVLSESETKRLNAIMQVCGFYDESGEFAFRVGLPGKSGVGGGIVAIMPNLYSIAVWSPKLNEKGNSYRGMKFLEYFTTQTHVSIF